MGRALHLTAAWILVSFTVACAGRSNDAEYAEGEVDIAAARVDPAEEGPEGPARAAPPTGTLWRDEVDATVDAGLGWFLQRVEVEPALDNGRFRGFRVIALRPADYWAGVDLRAGDVVLSVNGMPIERETQAFEAFQAIKKASEVRIKLLRGGAERELVYKIVAPPDAIQPESTGASRRHASAS